MIQDHWVLVQCGCSHRSEVQVSALLALPRPPATIADAVRRFRCQACGRVGVSDYRIFWKAPAQ